MQTAKPLKEHSLDLLSDLVGCFIYSVGVQSFSAPFNLPPGGVTGIAMIIHYLIGIPVSISSFLINIPILIASFFKLGKRFTFRSMKTVIILSITLQLALYLPTYQDDIILATIFGGVLQGIGLAIVFLRGSTTGGIDILSKLIQLRFPHLSMGRLLLAIDGLVLVSIIVVYKSLGNAMYALIMVFVSSKVIDGIIYGIDSGQMLLIVSEKHQAISNQIHLDLARGSTLLQGTGTYTNEDRPVLLCAVPTHEFHTVKKLVYRIDPAAFVITVETNEILGEGFKPILPDEK